MGKEVYILATFKDNVYRKTIEKFAKKETANRWFDKYMEKSKNIIFEKKFERSWPCKYELCILKTKGGKQDPLYFKDELGRNRKAILDDDQYTMIRIEPYRIEELIYDIQQDKRITVEEFINIYLPKNKINMVSGLNHKIIVQSDEKISLFSLKTMKECGRFLESLRKYFLSKKNVSNIIIRDMDTIHRKYLYDLLVSKGFDKRALYKQSTNHPMSK